MTPSSHGAVAHNTVGDDGAGTSLAFDLSREYPPLQGPTSQMSFLFHGLPLKTPLAQEAVIVCFQLHGSQSILDLAIVRCLNSYSFLDR